MHRTRFAASESTQTLRHHADAIAPHPRATFPSRHQRRPSETLACPPPPQFRPKVPTVCAYFPSRTIPSQYKSRATEKQRYGVRFTDQTGTAVTGW